MTEAPEKNPAAPLRMTASGEFDESGILSAFDLNRNLIYAIAAKVYGRGHKGSYELVAADF